MPLQPQLRRLGTLRPGTGSGPGGRREKAQLSNVVLAKRALHLAQRTWDIEAPRRKMNWARRVSGIGIGAGDVLTGSELRATIARGVKRLAQ